MISKILSENLYINSYGGLVERFHFSFGDYVDAENGQFGVLTALNEFVLDPGAGFSMHAHHEIEIISYCLHGELTHIDNMGNRNVIRQGDIQYLSAGTGISHSELNKSKGESLHFYQIWIKPNKPRLAPTYKHRSIPAQAHMNHMLKIASGERNTGVIRVAQDVNIYIAELKQGKDIAFSNPGTRQCYFLCLEGSVRVNEQFLEQRDALKVFGDTRLDISAQTDSHLLLIEMAARRVEAAQGKELYGKPGAFHT